VRDRLEGIPVTAIYYGISWFSTILAIVLFIVGLWNATLLPSEKGFYAFASFLGIFGAIAVQKNTRDSQIFETGRQLIQTLKIIDTVKPLRVNFFYKNIL
jgi:hypothetical protein